MVLLIINIFWFYIKMVYDIDNNNIKKYEVEG